MFQSGNRYRLPDPDGTVAVVEVLDAGLLHLPTGRLVACDPFFGSSIHESCAAFTVTVPPGHYPVSVAAARVDPAPPDMASSLRLGVAAKLTIRDEPVVAWELALRPGQDLAALGPDERYCFGVDSGNGSFFDASAVDAVVDAAAELNIVMFDCGRGDGCYATWIGRGATGAPACFAADLVLLSDSFGPLSG